MIYNFHDELKKTKENPDYVLPEDINAPVIKYLEDIGCIPGAEKLRLFQELIRYGKIEITHKKRPDKCVSIQIDCGMSDGYQQYEVEEKGDWVIETTHKVRNKNLKKKKRGDHGSGSNNGTCGNNGKTYR